MTVEPLTAADRCDRCGAQAYVRVTLPTGSELLFCAHHGREYAPKLRELDAQILDESERLDESQPVPAASAGLSD
jgi:ribosomal protein L37E